MFCAADTRELDEKLEAYKQCIRQLPSVNHATLKQLVLHLTRWEISLVVESRSKSWNLRMPFFRPRKSQKLIKLMESRGKSLLKMSGRLSMIQGWKTFFY